MHFSFWCENSKVTRTSIAIQLASVWVNAQCQHIVFFHLSVWSGHWAQPQTVHAQPRCPPSVLSHITKFIRKIIISIDSPLFLAASANLLECPSESRVVHTRFLNSFQKYIFDIDCHVRIHFCIFDAETCIPQGKCLVLSSRFSTVVFLLEWGKGPRKSVWHNTDRCWLLANIFGSFYTGTVSGRTVFWIFWATYFERTEGGAMGELYTLQNVLNSTCAAFCHQTSIQLHLWLLVQWVHLVSSTNWALGPNSTHSISQRPCTLRTVDPQK